MDKLVIDHSYALGIAWDKTEYRNHGLLYQTPPGTGYFQGSLSFALGRTAPGSAVVVPPSPSLQEMGAVRVRSLIYVAGPAVGNQRLNIVEGHLSFAFFINPDLSLEGTFRDPSDNWTGIRTQPHAIIPDQWVEVEYRYDGISAAEIQINGARAAATYNPASLTGPPMIGPVRGVGPHGVFIGHWPEPFEQYTFEGYIRLVQVYKRDDLDDLLKLLDPCCLRDLGYWYELGDSLRTKGYDRKFVRQILNQLLELGTNLVSDWRGGTEQGTQEFNQLMQQFLYALANRSSVPIGPALRPLVEWIDLRTNSQQQQALNSQVTEILKQVPFSQEELLALGDRLCFSGLRDAIEKEVQNIADDPKWQERHRKDHRHTGGGKDGETGHEPKNGTKRGGGHKHPGSDRDEGEDEQEHKRKDTNKEKDEDKK